MIAVIAVRPERQDHRRAGEELQPSARGRRLTDRRRLTRLRKRLTAQACPVMIRAITQSYRRRLLLSANLNQVSRINASAMDKIVQAASHSKQHQEEARFCFLLGVTFHSLTRLTGISHLEGPSA
jgi:hypothetical protein